MLRSTLISIIFLSLPLFIICQSSVYQDSINNGNAYLEELKFQEALQAFEGARVLADSPSRIREATSKIESTLNQYTEELQRRNKALRITQDSLKLALILEGIQSKYAESRRLALVADGLIDLGKYPEAYDTAYQAKVTFDSLIQLGKFLTTSDPSSQTNSSLSSLILDYFPYDIERAFAQAVQHHKTEELYLTTAQISNFELLPGYEQILVTLDNQNFAKIAQAGNVIFLVEGSDEILFSTLAKNGRFHFASYIDSNAILTDLERDTSLNFIPHEDLTNFADFSDDGEYLVTCSRDNTAKLWQTDGKLIATLIGHTANVYEASFSKTDNTILTRSYDGTARLWDFEGNIVGDSIFHDNYIYSIAFSEDGTSILSAAGDGSIKKWNNTGQFLSALTPHEDVVINASFIPGTNLGYSFSIDGEFKLLDLENDTEVLSHALNDERIYPKQFPSSKKLFLGLTSGQFIEFNLASQQEISAKNFEAHNGPIIGIEHNTIKDLLLTTSQDGNALLMLPNRSQLMNIALNNKNKIPAKFSNDGTKIYAVINNKLTYCPLPDTVWENESPK